MEELGVVVAAIAVLLIFALFHLHLNNRKYPPGPYGLPLLGYLPFVDKCLHLSFTRLSGKYGNVISVTLGFKPVVVLNDFEAIREALVVQKDTFSGRPRNFLFSEIHGNDVITSQYGPLWHKQKLFIMRKLNELIAARSSNEEGVIYEVDKLTEYLKTKNGQAVEMKELMFLPIVNVVCKLSYGKRYETEKCEDVRQLKDAFNRMQLPTNVMKYIPFVKILFNNQFRNGARQLWSYAKREVDCRETDSNGSGRKDFTDLYLEEIRQCERNNGTEIPPFTSTSHLVGALFDLLMAGIESSESTFLWSLLYLAHNPHAQSKVQQELDGLMTNDSSLSPNSKSLAPFTRATLMEVMRIASLAPLAVPHRTVRDTVLLGHKIPKGTTVFPNLYAVHHDERYWGDPDVFRPERFLNDDGQVIIDNHLIPFSIGPRVCMGEKMAQRTIFLFFTCLLRRFTFTFAKEQPKPSLEPENGGITINPQPFSLVVTHRQ